MHIEDEVEVVGLAPAYNAVDAGETILILSKSHIVFVGEEFIMEWKADGIGSCGSNEVDVIFSDVIIFESCPELGGVVRPYEFADKLIDLARGIHPLESKHVSFGIKPVAKICTDYV